jgi:quinol monooxygenase YgiN
MKQQQGFISTQLHRGIAGSTTFVNIAVWESAHALARAIRTPVFQAHLARYPTAPSPGVVSARPTRLSGRRLGAR